MSARASVLRPPPSRASLSVVHGPRQSAAGRRLRKDLALLAVSVLLIGGAIYGVLLLQVQLAQSAFKLDHITSRLESARTINSRLQLEAARLGDFARIERYARHRLGMIDPAATEYVAADIPGANDDRWAGTAMRPELPADGEAATAVAGAVSGGAAP